MYTPKNLPQAETEVNGQKYLLNGEGHLCPIETVREVDLLRHELVNDLFGQALDIQRQLAEFKKKLLDELHSFSELSNEKYGVKIGGPRGNQQFHSHNHRLKIVIEIQDRLTFDERLQAAKVLIDKCLLDWAAGTHANLRLLITDAFRVNKQKTIDTRRILSLRKLNIEDERWQRAMQAIGESLSVQHSKEYVRFYIANEHGEYQPISLDIAAL